MEKKLKWACIGIYSFLFVIICMMVVDFHSTKKVPHDETQMDTIPVPGMIDYTIPQIGEMVEEVVATTVQPVPQLVDQLAALRESYVAQIASIRWGYGDTDFTLEDAENLLDKIERHASNNNISLQNALTIVNVESDFKSTAYHKNTHAYGLTQSTPVCLNEYNLHNGTKYTLSDLFDEDINLEVGFWYYNRILTHYADTYDYITTSTPETSLRDAYLAYNIGVTKFNSIGRTGRNDLRNGIYPCNMYGSKKGDTYFPIHRYSKLARDWS